jgi:hypothetical protein
MSYKSRPRLRVRHLTHRCAAEKCREKASRFQDVPGQERKWFCAECFKQQENSNVSS